MSLLASSMARTVLCRCSGPVESWSMSCDTDRVASTPHVPVATATTANDAAAPTIRVVNDTVDSSPRPDSDGDHRHRGTA